MRISDWSSDVCSSDLSVADIGGQRREMDDAAAADRDAVACCVDRALRGEIGDSDRAVAAGEAGAALADQRVDADSVGSGEAQQAVALHGSLRNRSEEHTSELQSLMRISYAVFCLKK